MRDVPYAPKILQKVANNLYSRADSVVAQLALLWMFILGGAGFAASVAVGTKAGPWVAGGAIMGLLVGYVIAQPRVLALRSEAQQLLVMREIERNTRAVGAAPAVSPIGDPG